MHIERSRDVVGGIVARFDVPELHDGQKFLVNYVRERHWDTAILLGVHGGVRNRRHGLTFEERVVMIRQSIRRKLTILPLPDHPFDQEQWSRDLDELLAKTFPERSFVLYGSRDSCIDRGEYKGKLPTELIAPRHEASGTQVRAALKPPHTAAARAAILWDQQHRFPFIYSTSDLAIRNPNTGQVLLTGKSQFGTRRAFMGGHAEKSDGNGLVTVTREQSEEIKGIVIGQPTYVATEVIDDPRYRGTQDGVMTTFYVADYLGGTPTPHDDISVVEWISPKEFPNRLVPWHQKLGQRYIERFGM